ncbi:MAG: tetratricopeptide repeat protein [Okeania sp. SIO2C9]|uniref:tetratricopeptide repeat protein n=1 Tax=Okeania sp. SIO2C9 TaxID=2607791 RepID=UPI0013C11EB5|nr:tetratricopeptide repeat protein [Okeania sp. SIO2C9]NEQ75829.1 tetratricopeptide repeat protein [Okeania sp. SIO2C9]
MVKIKKNQATNFSAIEIKKYFLLGNTAYLQKEFDKAITYFQKALEIIESMEVFTGLLMPIST